MMNVVAKTLSFVADKNLTPQINLDAIIKYAKVDLAKIFPDKDWDKDKWIVGTWPNGKFERVAFVKKGNKQFQRQKNGMPVKGEVLSQPFRDFAKAFLVVMQSERGIKRQDNRMSALKYLEKAQIEVQGKADVVSINASVFIHAISIVESVRDVPYPIASQFKVIKDFLNKYHLTSVHISWQHGLKSIRRSTEVGEERLQWEKERLPPAELFHCMPFLINGIKNDPNAPSYDVLPVYYFMLMACSPARADELCYKLPVDCLYTPDNGMTYLRWFPAKGGKPVLKDVHPQMADWVHEIYDTLKKHTDEGRKIARWYEKNPTSLYLPDHLQHLRAKETVSIKEGMQITGKTKKSQFNYIVRKTGVKSLAKSKKAGGLYRFDELEKGLLKYWPLPPGFPYRNPEMKLKFSEALFTIPKNAMNFGFQTEPWMCEGIDYDQISPKFASTHKTVNILKRHGYTMADGSPIVVGMHSPRHLIDAIRNWKNKSDKYRAQQAGRKDKKQNAHYEHMTGNDLVAMGLEDGVIGPVTALAKHAGNAPVSIESVRAMVSPHLHITEYGFCAHDFARSPCGKWGDHLLCSEQWYIKGAMPEKERLLKSTLDQTERLLDLSIGVDEDGMPEYDHWAENHSLKVDRLKSLISLLEDPNVPDGSLIHLNGKEEFSISSRALDHRLMLNRRGSDKELLEAVTQIRAGVNEAEQMIEKEEYLPELLRDILELIDQSEFD